MYIYLRKNPYLAAFPKPAVPSFRCLTIFGKNQMLHSADFISHFCLFSATLFTTVSSNGKTYFLYFRPMEIETKNSARFGFARTIHLCSFLEVGP